MVISFNMAVVGASRCPPQIVIRYATGGWVFGLFKKKPSVNAPLPSPEAEPKRYAGRPLLIVLENYVLDCIGELPPEKEVLARSVVQRVWAGGDDWKATVRAQLHLEPTLDESVRGMWLRNQELAKQHNQPLHPIQFAKMVVDQNFAQLIG
jgi:hypothetical protein